MLPKKLVFIDTETTGGSSTRDRVIEVGAIRVENGKITNTFTSLIDPDCYIPEEITRLTGILPSQLEGAPTFRQIADELSEIMDDAVMVAHNARFDFGFLKNEFIRIRQEFSPKQICTVRLSRALFPQFPHHNLDSIIERYGFECKNRHRAFDDAMILWQFYQKVLEQFEEERILEVINKIVKRPTLPIKIPLEVLNELPKKPGVYIFYGEGGMPLYVGKSVNIHSRVLSHFSSDVTSSREMSIAQQIENIETVVTSGELGALFRESVLVKKLQPLYNRKLRLKQKLTILKQTKYKDGFLGAEVFESPQILVEDLADFLGVYRSRRSLKHFLANIAKEFELCEKLLGLEKTKGACFGYRLGRCKGACLGKEDPYFYNSRFIEAFASYKLKSWPFNGAIQILEKNEDGGESHIFDKWCYLGSIVYNEFGETQNFKSEVEFDLDTYKILDGFLRSQKNPKAIKPFNFNSSLI
jgi:DNA polymerase-3 subunit epsilon